MPHPSEPMKNSESSGPDPNGPSDACESSPPAEVSRCGEQSPRDHEPRAMMWFPLVPLCDVEIRRAKRVVLGKHTFCVVRPDERTAVIFDDACPHLGLSLAGGKSFDDRFVCPWHAWEFQLADGRSPVTETIAVRRWPTRVNRRGVVCVGVTRGTADEQQDEDHAQTDGTNSR